MEISPSASRSASPVASPLTSAVVNTEGAALVTGQGAVLEGVLGGTGGGEDDATGTAAELLGQMHGVAGARDRVAGECAAVAAVEDEHDPPGVGPGELVVDEAGRYRCGAQRGQFRIAGGQIEPAVGVFDAVPGEVQQQQVVPVATGEERRDAAADGALVRVGEELDVEAADRRGAEHAGQCVGIVVRGAQLRQGGIVVVGVGDDQCPAHAGQGTGG